MYYDFFNIAVFAVLGILLVYGGMLLLSLFRPDKPNETKLSTYECGEEAFGSSWVRFDMRFYTVALIFVIFDLEIAFLFPWARVFQSIGGIAVVEGLIFVLILFLGLVYVWAKGDLDWVKAFSEGNIVGADRPRTKLIRRQLEKRYGATSAVVSAEAEAAVSESAEAEKPTEESSGEDAEEDVVSGATG